MFHPTPTSNDEYLQYSGSLSQYSSVNTRTKSIQLSTPHGSISKFLTFIDTFKPEDTLSFHADLVENIEVFFQILETNKNSF